MQIVFSAWILTYTLTSTLKKIIFLCLEDLDSALCSDFEPAAGFAFDGSVFGCINKQLPSNIADDAQIENVFAHSKIRKINILEL